MFHHLPPLKSLRAFEAAARLGSFTLAADELSVTQGAVSYQVRMLEDKLGVLLFHRKVRQISLTENGEQLFQLTHRLFNELQDNVLKIMPSPVSSVITISVSTFFATRWLSARLGQFMNQYPDITIRLQHSVNDPDFSVDEVDMAIRWGDGKWSGCASELLVASPMIALCSPDLLGGESPLGNLDDLPDQIFLHDQPGNDSWGDWLQLAGYPELGDGPGPLIMDPNVRVQSAIDGHGLLLANQLLTPEIEQGLLVEPFPIRLTGMGFYLVYREGALTHPVRTKFRNWLLSEASKEE